VPASELHELLSRKLAQCGVMFDFLDCVADLKGKEVKRAALNQNNDITEFEKILKTNHSNIMDDPFIREHIEGILFLLTGFSYLLCHLKQCF